MAQENTPEPGESPNQEPALGATGPESERASTPTEPVPGAPGEDARGAVAAAKQGALTPGQRLAAKKAQKAVEKRESKEERKRSEEEARVKEQAEVERLYGRPRVEPALPPNVERVAGTFTHFLQENRERILLGVVAALVIAGLAIGGRQLWSAGATEQAAELGRALELATAGIDADDPDGKNDDGKPVFKSEQERATKALAAFERAAQMDPERGVAAWAKLGAASTELRLGKFEQARARFESVYDAHAGEAELAARALEGVGVAQEAAGKTDQALKAYEQLKSVEGSKELAEFHIARVTLAKGDREGGKKLLKALYDQLSTPSEGSAPSPYLKSEVEVRLAELDSTLVDKGSVGDQPQQFSEEQLQRLLEQLQKQGKGEPGAGGE